MRELRRLRPISVDELGNSFPGGTGPIRFRTRQRPMTIYRFGSRYSRWDGTQQINSLDASEIMQALSDDLLESNDINLALQRLFNWGFQRQNGEQVPGLRE